MSAEQWAQLLHTSTAMKEFGVGTTFGQVRRAKTAQRGLSTLAQLGLVVAVALPAVGAFTAWGLSTEDSISGEVVAQTPRMASSAQAFGFGTAGRTGKVARIVSDAAETGKRILRGASKCTGDSCAPGSGMCFVAGTEVVTDVGPVAIEDVVLGSAVQTIETGAHDGALAGRDWVKVEVEANGTSIALLRPRAFVEDHDLAVGTGFDLALTEMGVEGIAKVQSITATEAPNVDSGFVVTGLYTRSADDVYTLTIEGQTVEPTGKHRFFSVDRGDWVATKDLRVGERLRTEDGEVTLTSIERKPGVHQVFNLEVAHEHTYLVSPLRLYTHNQYTVINTRVKPQKIDTTFDNVRKFFERLDEKVNPRPIEVSDLTPEQLQQATQQRRTPQQYAAVLTQGQTQDFDTAFAATGIEIFGQNSGTELFLAALRDIRNNIGEERFMEAMIKANSGKDYDSKVVTALAYITRGESSKARRLIAEAEDLSPSGERGLYRGLLRRLEVLADVFDEGVEEVPADVINKYFRDQTSGPIANPLDEAAVGIGSPPDADLLRILDRVDGRRSRYRVERLGDELSTNNNADGTFLAQVFTPSYQAFSQLLNRSVSGRVRKILDAVRNRELDGALRELRALSSDSDNFQGPESLARGQAIERLESAINTATLRFRPRDEPFTRRATAPELKLSQSQSFSDQPRPVVQLASQLANDLGVNGRNSDFYQPRTGVRQQDLADVMNEAFRATIRGDREGAAKRLDQFESLLTESNRAEREELIQLLRKDLDEYADLYRRGESTSEPPEFVFDPNPRKVDAEDRARGARLARELANAQRPGGAPASAGN